MLPPPALDYMLLLLTEFVEMASWTLGRYLEPSDVVVTEVVVQMTVMSAVMMHLHYKVVMVAWMIHLARAHQLTKVVMDAMHTLED